MNELLRRINESKIGKKNIILICGAMLAVLILLFSSSGGAEPADVSEKGVVSAEEYTRHLEKELAALVENINGAGKAEVMITLESCYENVYAKGYDSKNKTEADSYSSEETEEYIIVKNGSNSEECLIVKVYEPQIKGVAVIAEGAGDTQVKAAITQTVCALFDISSAKVSVEKMQKTGRIL